MNELSVEDLKNVLLDLYMAQREIAALRAQVAYLQDQEKPDKEATGDRHS